MIFQLETSRGTFYLTTTHESVAEFRSSLDSEAVGVISSDGNTFIGMDIIKGSIVTMPSPPNIEFLG